METLEKYNNQGIDEKIKEFSENLKVTIAGWDYLVNWDKVFDNVSKVEKSLNILNYLIGKEDIKRETEELLKEYPEVLDVIPIILAVRYKTFHILEPTEEDMFAYKTFSLRKRKKVSDKAAKNITEFMDKIGLLELLKNKTIKNLVDFVFGVEVGLDTNARKNRAGENMERMVEIFIKEACKENKCRYLTQVDSKKVYKEWGLKIKTDKPKRKHDFIIENNGKYLIIECNNYRADGSKIKTTVDEYIALNKFVKDTGYEFCWITDGLAWSRKESELKKAYKKIDYIFNLNMLEKGLLKNLVRKL